MKRGFLIGVGALLLIAAVTRSGYIPGYDPAWVGRVPTINSSGNVEWKAGPNGPTGPTGSAGAAGPTGAKGATGATGPGFTPVVTAYTADHTLDASESGNTITNTGATGPVILTFPTAATGLRYRIERTANQDFYFATYTGPDYYLDGQIYNSGSPDTLVIMSSEVGAVLDVECPMANTWVATSKAGTWRAEGFASQIRHPKLPRYESYVGGSNDIGKVLTAGSTLAQWGSVGSEFVSATSTNNDAPAGGIGRAEVAQLLQTAATGMTDATPKNITSLSLGAGDWLLSGACGATGMPSNSSLTCWYSSTSATLPSVAAMADSQVQQYYFTGATNFNHTQTLPIYRIKNASTTTWYLEAQAGFGSGSVNVFATFRAWRPR